MEEKENQNNSYENSSLFTIVKSEINKNNAKGNRTDIELFYKEGFVELKINEVTIPFTSNIMHLFDETPKNVHKIKDTDYIHILYLHLLKTKIDEKIQEYFLNEKLLNEDINIDCHTLDITNSICSNCLDSNQLIIPHDGYALNIAAKIINEYVDKKKKFEENMKVNKELRLDKISVQRLINENRDLLKKELFEKNTENMNEQSELCIKKNSKELFEKNTENMNEQSELCNKKNSKELFEKNTENMNEQSELCIKKNSKELFEKNTENMNEQSELCIKKNIKELFEKNTENMNEQSELCIKKNSEELPNEEDIPNFSQIQTNDVFCDSNISEKTDVTLHPDPDEDSEIDFLAINMDNEFDQSDIEIEQLNMDSNSNEIDGYNASNKNEINTSFNVTENNEKTIANFDKSQDNLSSETSDNFLTAVEFCSDNQTQSSNNDLFLPNSRLLPDDIMNYKPLFKKFKDSEDNQ